MTKGGCIATFQLGYLYVKLIGSNEKKATFITCYQELTDYGLLLLRMMLWCVDLRDLEDYFINKRICILNRVHITELESNIHVVLCCDLNLLLLSVY